METCQASRYTGRRMGPILVALELIVLPLLLAYSVGEVICRDRSFQECVLHHASFRPRVNRERIKLDYDIARAKETGRRIVFVAGSSQARDCFDPVAVSELLADRNLVIVNAAGSAFNPIDLLALQRVWLPLRPAALVYMPHPFFLNDWVWPFQDQRYDWQVERAYHVERFEWDKREEQYSGILSCYWHWALYRRTLVDAMNRQIQAAFDGRFPRTKAIDLYTARDLAEDSASRADAWREAQLANPHFPLYKWAESKYFRFPTRASRALEAVLDVCEASEIPVLLFEAPHHPETNRFFEPGIQDAYKSELRRLGGHRAVVKFVESDAFPDIDDYFIDSMHKSLGSFLHARDARPVLAPIIADWIRQALPEP